jgi:hypothetical protein
MLMGTAFADVTPHTLIHLQGQMHARVAKYKRDPLQVQAIAIVDGDTRVVLVSVDICMLPDAYVAQVQQRCEQRFGISGRSVLLGATHTHVGPCLVDFNDAQVINAAHVAWLQDEFVRVVGVALADVEPVTMFAGKGWCEHMGWNRRGLHTNGKVDMYHGSWNADFAGIEGPRDGDVPVIFGRRANGTIKGIVTGFATHPNCVEGESFYSADLVGETRRYLHAVLAERPVIAYFTGAAGDTAPSIMENNPRNIQPWRGEAGVVRSGRYLGSEIAKVIEATIDPMAEQSLFLDQRVLSIGFKPWPADFDPQALKWESARGYYVKSHANWPAMTREQSPCDVRVNAVRIGDAVLCTNPAELYCRHGLNIKESSPAGVTMVAELTDGYCGYVPTRDAFARGGYSTWPGPTSKLAHDAGDQIVKATIDMLAGMFTAARC